MKVEDLKTNSRNPRRISREQKDMLQNALEAFGDLGGIVWNARRNQLVGGNQRASVIPKKSEIVIEHRYVPETRTGTIAEGYIMVKGEKFKYREVNWDEDREMAALIAANQHGGEWDPLMLGAEVDKLFKKGFDHKLTGFNSNELQDLINSLPKIEIPKPPQAAPIAPQASAFVADEPTLAEQVDMSRDEVDEVLHSAVEETSRAQNAFDEVVEEDKQTHKKMIIIIECPSQESRDALRTKLRTELVEQYGAKIY